MLLKKLILSNHILFVISISFTMILSCNIPEEIFDNPLDLEENAAKGIFPPALVFTPDSVDINLGESIAIDLYALAVDTISGAQIEIDYFSSALSILSIEKGDFFQGDFAPIFIFDDKKDKLIIYVTYMGPNKTNITGTGIIATITIKAKVPGSTFFSVSKNSVLLNQNATQIEINGFGRSLINAK